MKYNININQKALIEEGSQLDLVDAAILDYLYFMCSSVNAKIESQRVSDGRGRWTWVDFQSLLADLPLLRLNSASSVTNRIKKILAEGWIEAKRVGNQRLYIRITEKCDKLFILANSSIRENAQRNSKSYAISRTYNNTNDNNTNDLNSTKKPTVGDKTVDKYKISPKSDATIKRNEAHMAKIRQSLDFIGPVPKRIKKPLLAPHYED